MSSYYGERHRIEADRALQDERARRERLEASAVRDRLEKRSGRGEGRSALGLLLARLSADDAKASHDVSGVFDGLRKAAQRAGGSDGGVRNSTFRDPNYAQSSLSNWDHENGADITPRDEAERVGDVSGFGGSARDRRDLFSGDGFVGDAMEVLSAEDMKHIAGQRWRSRFS